MCGFCGIWDSGFRGQPMIRIADRQGILLALLLLFGLTLRVYDLGAQSVWIDEALSLAWAKLPVTSIVYEGAHDNQAPLYFILLRWWMRLGPETEAWARLFSALLGTVLIGVFYLFVSEFAEKAVALVSAGLLTVAPLAVWHSQDARVYMLMLVSSYAGLLFLLRYLRGGGLLFLIGSGIALECALYTHLYAIFLFPPLLLFLWVSRKDIPPIRLFPVFTTLVVVGAAYVPWIWIALTTSRLDAGFYRSISIFSLPYALYAFSVGYSLGPSVAELHDQERTSALLLAHWPVILLVTVLFGVAFLRGLQRLKAYCGRFGLLLLLILSLPLVLPVLITLVSQVTFNARYAIVSFPAYLLIVAIGIVSLRGRAAWLLGGSLAALMVASLMGRYYNPVYANADSRAAYRHIQAQRQPGDCVLVIGVTEAFRYYEGSEIQSRWLDLRQRDRIPVGDQLLREWSEECSGLWVVAGRTWESDPLNVIHDLLDKHFRPAGGHSFSGVEVSHYRSRKESEGS